jgi:hypothetical protein
MSDLQFYHSRLYASSLTIVRRTAAALLMDFTESLPLAMRTFYAPNGGQGLLLIVQARPEPGATEPDEGDWVAIQFTRRSDQEILAQFAYQLTDTPHLAQYNAGLRGIAGLLPDKLTLELLKLPDRPETDRVFAEYYSLRESGRKATIADLAKRHGLSAGYLRRIKSDYDKRTGRKKENE